MSLTNFAVITVFFGLLPLWHVFAILLDSFLEDCEVDMKYFSVIEIYFFNIIFS